VWSRTEPSQPAINQPDNSLSTLQVFAQAPVLNVLKQDENAAAAASARRRHRSLGRVLVFGALL